VREERGTWPGTGHGLACGNAFRALSDHSPVGPRSGVSSPWQAWKHRPVGDGLGANLSGDIGGQHRAEYESIYAVKRGLLSVRPADHLRWRMPRRPDGQPVGRRQPGPSGGSWRRSVWLSPAGSDAPEGSDRAVGGNARQHQWEAAHPDLASLAEQVQRLSGETERLRDLLRQHGTEPADKTA
jgi:hypothetical protein